MQQEEISQFYDDFSAQQIRTGANERLIGLYKKMLKLGLQRDSKVVELGSGVGVFTQLLLKKIKSGSIESVDLSEKSVAAARKRITSKLVHFTAADVVLYAAETKNADFITLMDVIEHIPLDQHAQLFQSITAYCGENTVLCINIPNPEYINYLIENKADGMQIIDQAVPISGLLKNLEDAGLELLSFKKYDIWEKEDYHFLTARKKRKFRPVSVLKGRSLWQKLQIKIDQLRYNF